MFCQPEKLIDLPEDPAEENNRLGNPEYATVVARLMTVIQDPPVQDNDAARVPPPEKAMRKRISSELFLRSGIRR